MVSNWRCEDDRMVETRVCHLMGETTIKPKTGNINHPTTKHVTIAQVEAIFWRGCGKEMEVRNLESFWTVHIKGNIKAHQGNESNFPYFSIVPTTHDRAYLYHKGDGTLPTLAVHCFLQHCLPRDTNISSGNAANCPVALLFSGFLLCIICHPLHPLPWNWAQS